DAQVKGRTDDGGVGWEDQVRKVVHMLFEQARLDVAQGRPATAIRLYSDAGFSGTYATASPQMVRERREKRAETYEEAFREAVLQHASPIERREMENWLKAHAA